IAAAGSGAPFSLMTAIIVLGSTLLLTGIIARGQIDGATRDFAFSIVPIIYVGLPLAHMPLIRDLGDSDTSGWLQSVNGLSLSQTPAEGLGWLVLIVAATWMTDSAAYLGGRALGSHKLAPILSPGKTVEGAIAGVIFGGLTGAGAAMLLGLPIPWYAGMAIGLLVSALGQMGDLAESLLKRDIGVKDMGDLIPGHGGVLDRIDALLFTLPAGYYLILLVTEVNWP
ncbi:MAG: phosphatidate cytidylyltransferase, partial [Thermomicrobiaceae bacterium]